MSWQPVDFSEARSRDRRRPGRLERRLRFYIDETVRPDVVDQLRRTGANVAVGRPGLADETHAQEAFHQHRLIVTNDRDFLNERRFPQERFCGAVVIPDDFTSRDNHQQVLANLARLARWRGDLSGVKFEVTADAITGYFGDGAKMMLRTDDGQLFEWVDG